jgi:predicted metal-dependent phosphoesterase TrpH
MKIDLHVHTNHSLDAIHDIKQIIKQAKRKKLGAIGITDHNKLFSYDKAKELSKQYNIKIIPGIEIGKLGYLHHILALNIINLPKSQDINEIIEFIDEEGGITIAPHPFSKLGFKNYEKYKFHAVERINGLNFLCNFKFKSKSNIPQLSNSDAHATYMLGYAYTETEYTETVEQILENIRKGICIPKGTSIPIHLIMRFCLTLSIRKTIKCFNIIKNKSFAYEDTIY